MNYDALKKVLDEALHQATDGKGAERHAAGRDFEQQPIVVIPKLLQDDTGVALLYQAIKKCQESLRMGPAAARRERLGAINYIAASLLLPGLQADADDDLFRGKVTVRKPSPSARVYHREIPRVTTDPSLGYEVDEEIEPHIAPGGDDRGAAALEAGRVGKLPADGGVRARVAAYMPLPTWLELGGSAREWHSHRDLPWPSDPTPLVEALEEASGRHVT